MRAALVPVLALALGCVMRSPQPLAVSATQDWVQTLSFAQQSVSAGRFAAADSALAAFATRSGNTPEAREVYYWRALYLLDPANRAPDPRAAVRLLDAYLGDSTVVTYRAEARVLRALAISVDSLAQAAQTAQATAAELRSSATERTPSTREEELQKEVQRLRDSLVRANADLDRIRRRLTAPKRPH
jgi:hypothetical protein